VVVCGGFVVRLARSNVRPAVDPAVEITALADTSWQFMEFLLWAGATFLLVRHCSAAGEPLPPP
jgi:hypothetical protein